MAHNITSPKICTKCHREYPATLEFWHKCERSGLRLKNRCKMCVNSASKQWQKANPSNMLENNRRHRKAHPNEVRESNRKSQRRRYQSNPNTITDWQRANPDKMRVYRQRYRARKKQAGGSFSREDIQLMMINQRGHCWYCQCDISAGYHIEHRIPLSRGGTNNPSNLVLACSFCNLSKGSKMPDEWSDRLL